LSLKQELDTLFTEYEDALVEGIQDTTEILCNSVIDRTPVQTGKTKNSWDLNTSGATVSRQPDIDGKDAKNSVKSTLSSLTLKDTTMYLVNDEGIVGDLEYGASKKAPQGMVRLSILEWDGYFNKVVK
jgi:hypothetical protein